MRSYTVLKISVLVFLLVYLVGGLATEILPAWQDKSVIPFYSWFLFDRVPNEGRTPTLRILEHDGERIEPPLLFVEAGGVVGEPRSPKARELIEKLSRSIRAKQKEEIERIRTSLERSFLPSCARYEVFVMRYDPIERWKTGHYEVQEKGKEEFYTPCPS